MFCTYSIFPQPIRFDADREYLGSVVVELGSTLLVFLYKWFPQPIRFVSDREYYPLPCCANSTEAFRLGPFWFLWGSLPKEFPQGISVVLIPQPIRFGADREYFWIILRIPLVGEKYLSGVPALRFPTDCVLLQFGLVLLPIFVCSFWWENPSLFSLSPSLSSLVFSLHNHCFYALHSALW